MTKKAKHIAWHVSAFSVRITMFLLFMLFVATVAFVWRVSREPLDVSFAKKHLEYAMRDAETGSYVLLDRAVLYWPDLKGPLYLEVEGGQLMNAQGIPVLSINTAAISFSRAGLLTGRVMPKAVILREPTLRLVRDGQGGISLGIGNTAAHATQENREDQFELTTRIFGYIARPGYESAHNSLISRLQSFAIEKARLMVDDQIAQQTWSLPDFNLKLQSTSRGMDGNVNLKLPDVGLDESSLNIDLEYIWDQKNVELSADLKSFDFGALAEHVPELDVLANQDIVADAHIETILDEFFLPADMRVRISSEKGSISHPDISDDNIPYKNLAVNATYSYAGKSLNIDDTMLTIGDIPLTLTAQLTHTDTQISGPVRASIAESAQKNIDPLWPKALRGDSSEEWIVQKMSEGIFKNVWVEFNLEAIKNNNVIAVEQAEDVATEDMPLWNVDAKDLVAGFEFEGMNVDYRAPLDPAKNAYGSGRFDLSRDELSIHIDHGKIGVMNVEGADLVFDQVVAVGKGGADLTIPLKAKIADVMRYISKDPINLGDRLGMDIAKVRGDGDVVVKLNFPTQKDVKIQDFKISVSGTVNDVLLPDVVETLDLSGGPMQFNIKDGQVSLSGKAMLEKRSMDFTWKTFLESEGKPYKEKVLAKITADPNLRNLLGIDLSDFIEGSLPVEIDYTLQRDRSATATVKVDASPALFFVEPFDFAKPTGQKAQASFVAHLSKGVLQKITALKASGEKFDLPQADIQFAQIDGKTELKAGNLKNFTLDKTKGNLDFSFDNDGVVTINVQASTFDAQPFMDAGDAQVSSGQSSGKAGANASAEYDEPPMKIYMKSDIMFTAKNESVSNVKSYMDIDGQGRFNRMEMDGQLKGGQFGLRYKPDQEGKRTFRMESDNAGAFLKSFGVYNNLVGGTLTIFGQALGGVNDRNLKGRALITDFRVMKAPFLTRILSLVSLTGIGDALSDDGLEFSKLEANFEWLYRKKGSLLKIEDGRTSGNALGLLFEGTFDNQSRTIDLEGTVVPMSEVNNLIGKIPLVGDILTGGSGGIFAATYSVKGSSEDPVISANPLSVLTPGILRRILWE